ncbi:MULTISPECIES: response regulator [Metabacillus]|uniref:Response regulator transcription factor n=1 Tax=Metabacillus hrfriensis TaxID=3048891 RepID=A0ACD4RDG7_9BACI|nr:MULTISPECIES: response regulator transcription factor [Metabacillus]UAL53004.1 response regulator transcription factor [Metabacillus dongyingensis]USK29324.1 response regulator transcription factor [Bacillus sp. CMF21]WHZ58543.1 response regulator transcription factor [Metabacillus sp. CT-WN-B3]
MGIRLLIADDHKVVRRGLHFFLSTQKDIEIVGEAEDGEEAVKMVRTLLPDVILMDLSMPVMNGVDATKEIRTFNEQIKIIILTSYADQDHVIPAIQAGASGYQLKDVEPDELVHTIREVLKGESKLHPKVTTHVMSHLMQTNQKDEKLLTPLTNRENDVLKEIAKGKSNKEIAASLYITEKTVKTHVSNILSKLSLSDRTQAALYAVKNGLDK